MVFDADLGGKLIFAGKLGRESGWNHRGRWEGRSPTLVSLGGSEFRWGVQLKRLLDGQFLRDAGGWDLCRIANLSAFPRQTRAFPSVRTCYVPSASSSRGLYTSDPMIFDEVLETVFRTCQYTTPGKSRVSFRGLGGTWKLTKLPPLFLSPASSSMHSSGCTTLGVLDDASLNIYIHICSYKQFAG